MAMKAKLVRAGSSRHAGEIVLESFPVCIGRNPDADVRPGDPSVSPWHCQIDERGGRLLVHDLGSERGTFVNGVRIDVAPLLPGDTLQVADSRFVVLYGEPHEEAGRAQPPATDDVWVEQRPALSRSRSSAEAVVFFDLVDLLERQRQKLRDRFTHVRSSAEAMFPDPPHPEHLEFLLVQEMKNAGVQPQYVFAFEKTGLLITEFNRDTIPEEQLARWQDAVTEYEERHACPSEATRYPVGAVTMYGPDKRTTTLIVAAVMTSEDAEPVCERWSGRGVRADPEVKRQIAGFFLKLGVRSVVLVRQNLGCPHQEGVDYPLGEDCPYCPYWRGRQRGHR
jgi:pSer/pThr/pTyr-binding forkhead associated (FHA) protein